MGFGPGKDVGQEVADRATELYVRGWMPEKTTIPECLNR
jgi:hypothetical protein